VFFQRFPQGIFVLHSFCTTVAAFFVAGVYRFKHSAGSACVRCFRRLLKIAAELAASAVLEGELLEVSQACSGALQDTRALRPPQKVLARKAGLSCWFYAIVAIHW
jgi:hypothetical protein